MATRQRLGWPGIPVQRYRALAYVISGVLAAIGGILLSARLGRGDIGAGNAYLLQAVAAALIGFAVLGANRPNAFGTIVGALFIGVLFNGLTMFNVPYYAQDFIQGVPAGAHAGADLHPQRAHPAAPTASLRLKPAPTHSERRNPDYVDRNSRVNLVVVASVRESMRREVARQR